MPVFTEKLINQVEHSITKDRDKWKTGYVCKPSRFFNTKDSVFYPGNKEWADYECSFILQTQLEDGSWNIPWQWEGYPQEWPVARNWWKSSGILENLLFLKGMDCLK